MTDSIPEVPKGKKTLDRIAAEVLNMPTRYKWRGATNSFAKGELAYSPNEIARLNIPESLHERNKQASVVWSAPFLANGARVRVVMAVADSFRIFPVDADANSLRYMAECKFASMERGVDRHEASKIHAIKGVMVPAEWLTKLAPEDAHDDVWEATQREMALAGVDNEKVSPARVDFEELLRFLYLAVDAHMHETGHDLMGALASARARSYLEGARSISGTRAARSGLAASREGGSPGKRRKSVAGQPMHTIFDDDLGAARIAAHKETMANSPLGAISMDTGLRMPSDAAMTEILGRMQDTGVMAGDYRVVGGLIIGPAGLYMTGTLLIAGLLSNVENAEAWDEYKKPWIKEAAARDKHFSMVELSKFMSWPDSRLTDDIDLGPIQELSPEYISSMREQFQVRF